MPIDFRAEILEIFRQGRECNEDGIWRTLNKRVGYISRTEVKNLTRSLKEDDLITITQTRSGVLYYRINAKGEACDGR